VELLAGHWSYDSQVVGLSPGWVAPHSGFGQATCTRVPLCLCQQAVKVGTSQGAVMFFSWEGNCWPVESDAAY